MFPLMSSLGNKSPGELIRAKDWNDLIAAIDQLNTTVDGRLDSLESAVASMQSEINSLTAFRNQVTALLNQYYQVRLQTSRVSYAIGEQAEITATVTDLFGSPVTSRPWIDFIGTWGQLKPAPGFTTQASEGGRAVAVRTNAQGIARVLVRSDHVDSEQEANEDEVLSVVNTPVSGQPFHQMILGAASPVDALPAYRAATTRYDSVVPFQRYVDAYYTYVPMLPRPVATGNWRDYRTTIMAFVKDDNNPQTPDTGRAVSSIQLTFRDWIYPWFYLDYIAVEPSSPPILDLRDRFRDIIDGDLLLANQRILEIIEDTVRVDSILGKQRDYILVYDALERVNPGQADAIQVINSVKNGVGLQQSLEFSLHGGTLPIQGTALEAITGVSTYSDQGLSALAEQFEELQGAFNTTTSQVNTFGNELDLLQATVNNHSGSLSSLLSETGTIGIINSRIDAIDSRTLAIDTKVNGLETAFDLQRGEIEVLASDNGALGLLRNRVDALDNQFVQLGQLNPQQILDRTESIGMLQLNLDQLRLQVDNLRR